MDGPSPKAQKIDKRSWYYECTTHMQILVEVDASNTMTCQSVFIPWRMVKKSLDRSYKPRRKRSR
jgi:hypothetical protein